MFKIDNRGGELRREGVIAESRRFERTVTDIRSISVDTSSGLSANRLLVIITGYCAFIDVLFAQLASESQRTVTLHSKFISRRRVRFIAACEFHLTTYGVVFARIVMRFAQLTCSES